MQNFDFYNPTQIIFGKDTIGRLAELVPSEARVLVLFGGESARKNGTLAEVLTALGDRHVQEFGGIEPNPTYETLMRAVALVRRDGLDFLLAVGGGSVIDGTKFVAAAVPFAGEPWQILESFGAKVSKALPFGSVLTLPATGSEMNNGAVVTNKALQAKLPFRSPLVFPCFSILDPQKTFTLPESQIANGVVDAFVHVMEQYLTYPAGGLAQDRFAEGLLQTLIEIGPKALATPNDYEVRANLMWVATLALNGLIGAGVPQDWATHMIGHELTAAHGIDHARTLAVILPSLLTHCQQSKRAKLLQYADRVWQLKEGDEQGRIEGAIARTRAFFEQMGIATRLADYGLDQADIAPLISQLEAHGMTALGEHRSVTPEVSRAILEASL
ncbi:iron-containing alcohol dehydrogenase [Aeromonas molluscorum]|uniref:Iron-containing alcohol dehydrogenase n=1 Tax=Aeromonas molluscorum 848 TaxID=1268236 RepID=R1H0B2_9GAMM|nr:iron-containing alcohol dehydrogenase [Aeromonas molluscorum]EOD54026.1 iron-containing alcohol dehydrogenase [Aeromonas molluscorum 848]